MFDAMDNGFKDLLNWQIAKLEAQIKQFIETDEGLAKSADVLRSVLGVSAVSSTMPPLMHGNMHCRAVDSGSAGT